MIHSGWMMNRLGKIAFKHDAIDLVSSGIVLFTIAGIGLIFWLALP